MLGFFLLYKNQAPAEDNVYNSSKTGEQKMADFFFFFFSTPYIFLEQRCRNGFGSSPANIPTKQKKNEGFQF
jgi:hypothetical protein